MLLFSIQNVFFSVQEKWTQVFLLGLVVLGHCFKFLWHSQKCLFLFPMFYFYVEIFLYISDSFLKL